jgi:hypothetical protein
MVQQLVLGHTMGTCMSLIKSAHISHRFISYGKHLEQQDTRPIERLQMESQDQALPPPA